tara:strand:- start:264 stop:1793 length:1530 start_codon:yes stop_codon:yes gene_type:complete
MPMSEEDRARGKEALDKIYDEKPKSARGLTLLFPPAGLVKMWISPGTVGSKIFGSIFVAFYSVMYAGAIMFLLFKTGHLHFEMQGNPIPIPTFTPGKPDFAKLEKHRMAQSEMPVITNLSGGTYWTDFRGPNRDGAYDEQEINVQWSSKMPELLWRQPCGGGYASFVVASGVAYTLEQRREEEALVAYDLKTGREIWVNSWGGHFQESMGGNGPRTTPQYHGGKIYALGGLLEFRCVDAVTGETLWRHDLKEEYKAEHLYFGSAASPLIVDDKVVVLTGQPIGTIRVGVVTFDKESGEEVWKGVREKIAYSSPVLTELLGVRQMLVFTAYNFTGMNPETGEKLWEFPWNVSHDNTIAQPVVVSTNQVFISAGYGHGCALLEFSLDGDDWEVEEVWRNKMMKNKFTSSVHYEGHVYGLDENILVCLDLESGRKKWKDGRYGYGQILLADGHIIILCGDGDIALVVADPEEWIEVARLSAIRGKTWNHPAIADGKLLVRNAREMACFDLAP